MRFLAAPMKTALALSLTIPLFVACQKAETPAAGGPRPSDNATAIETPPTRTHLGWELPSEWTDETPSSNMRLAQASIPGPAGSGKLAVFFFGPGQGGGVEANIERWVAQMEVAPGSNPVRETFEVGDLKIYTVEVNGTLQASTMGMGPTEAQPGSKLLGAVVEGPGGPWFFKVTGPAQTLDEQRDSFHDLLRSLRAEPL